MSTVSTPDTTTHIFGDSIYSLHRVKRSLLNILLKWRKLSGVFAEENVKILYSEPKEATHSSPTENTFTLGPIVPTRSPLPAIAAIAASQTLEYLVSVYLCFRDLRDPREYKNSSQGHGDEMWVAVVRTPVIL